MSERNQKRNGRTALVLVTVFAAMIGLTAASVPLYRLFCQVTGFGGTTQRADSVPVTMGTDIVNIRFNADSMRQLGWSFQPVDREVAVRVGEPMLVFYRAQNLTARQTVGTATFNVTPEKAAIYFNKIACFCFQEQRLAPGEAVDMPVSFFVDPEIVKDRKLDDVKTITLSYTFFEKRDSRLSLNQTTRRETP